MIFPLPSGKPFHNYGKYQCSMGKSTISMAMFNSYIELSEATHHLCIYIYIMYIHGNDIYIWLHLYMLMLVITIPPSRHCLIFLAAITEPPTLTFDRRSVFPHRKQMGLSKSHIHNYNSCSICMYIYI